MSMNNVTRMLALALSLGFGTAALAQETTTEAPAEGTTEAPAPAANTEAGQLNMGTEPGQTAAAGGPGSIYVAAKHGDWEQRCVKKEDGSDPCQLYQLLKDGSGNAVAEISMFALPAGGEAAAGATIIAPLETLLTEALRIQVDGSQGKVYPFTWCDENGCVARVGFTAAEVEGFKKGSKATLTIVPAVAPDQKVNLNISLSGFTAGYDAVAASKAK